MLYSGQSLGLIVAHTQSQAAQAAKLVRVSYKDCQIPVLKIKDAMKHPERTMIHAAGPPNVFDVGDVKGIFFRHCNLRWLNWLFIALSLLNRWFLSI